MSQTPGRAVLVSATTASTAARRTDGRPLIPGPADDGELGRWVAALPLPSLLLDGTGSLRAANPAWTTLSHLEVERSLGDGWLDSLDPMDRPLLVERLRSARLARSAGTFECRLSIGDGPAGGGGHRAPVSWSCAWPTSTTRRRSRRTSGSGPRTTP